eukprot:gb/GECH01013179.1/.p1 GENE.gb/GECH01013179.1/~~gb/GECH01013179.1/.p1  ORF type:complete len:238 (+),score=74.77 gb/GECH01013179.1/:1-714(+)
MSSPASISSRMLANQLKDLQTDPVEGFKVELADDSNLYNWDVFIQGPPDTEYAGGIFKAKLTFPKDYPYSPPNLYFVSDFWHPNVYDDGTVCISILHPPGEDEMSGERPEERWLPTQNPTSILLSVISMLADPNTSSPANVDASVEWRNNRKEFRDRVNKLVEKSVAELPRGFEMPKPRKHVKQHITPSNLDMYYSDSDEEDDDVEEEDYDYDDENGDDYEYEEVEVEVEVEDEDEE